MNSQEIKTPGVGVAGIAIEGERVLLIRRANAPAAGRWAFPGGRLEPAETLMEAARREFQEECGLTVSVGPRAGIVEVVEAPWHWIVIMFVVRIDSGTLSATDDALEARWIHVDNVAALATAPRTAELAARARKLVHSSSIIFR